MEKQLEFVTNNAFDSILITENDIVISVFEVTPEQEAWQDFLLGRIGNLNDWQGTPVDDKCQHISAWGDVIMIRHSDGTVIINDADVLAEKLSFYATT